MNAPDLKTALSQDNEVAQLMNAMGLKAKVASAQMARAPAAIKNRAFSSLAMLRQNVKTFIAANQLDLARAC